MAVYGVNLATGANRGGFISGTGWTPTIGPNQSTPSFGGGSTAIFVQFNGQTQNDDRVAKQFRKSGPALKFARAVFASLLGVAGGNAPIVQYARVRGQTGDSYTSLRAIDVVTVPGSGRAKNANDTAAFVGMLNRSVAPAGYARDLSGAGGGGKVRY